MAYPAFMRMYGLQSVPHSACVLLCTQKGSCMSQDFLGGSRIYRVNIDYKGAGLDWGSYFLPGSPTMVICLLERLEAQ